MMTFCRKRTRNLGSLTSLSIALGIALSAKPAHAIPEAEFPVAYRTQVLPYFESAPAEFLTAEDGVRLHYRVWTTPGARAAVVLAPGRTEPIRRYAELIYDLSRRGYAVLAMDPRGQGLSDRIARPADLGHVERFGDYVDDLERFARRVLEPRGYERRYLLGHSMGGTVGAMHVAGAPGRYAAVAYSAPMFEIDTGKYSHAEAWLLASLASWIGMDREFALGHGPYDPNAPFEGNDSTHSEVRFRTWPDAVREDPRLAVGGPSFRWVQQGLKATRRVAKLAKRHAAPTLVLQAGLDTVVRPGGQERFCSRAPDCQIERFPEAKHHLLQETDAIRDGVLARILEFFASH